MPALLSINNYHYVRGGAEAVFLRHNALFEEMGWMVAPFAMRHPDNSDTNWSEFFVEEIEYGSDYSLWEKVRRTPKVIYSLEACRQVDRLLDRFPADICHAHNIYHHLSPSVLRQVHRRSIPVVMTLHDLKIACPAYRMLASDRICERCKGGRTHNVLINRCIKGSLALSAVVLAENLIHRALRTFERHVDRFVAPSRFYIDKLVEWGWPAERFVHIPNAIDTKAFVPDFTAGKAFVYVGRLSGEKGIATLVRAAARAGVPLKIVGTGPEESALRQTAAGTDVEFLGYLQRDALHGAIRSARALVLPSEWYENAPLSILEAYALGKPVIGAAIGGIPELIREGVTGASFESGSIEALAAVLTRFSGLPDAAVSELGRAGRAWVEREFSMGQYGRRMVSLYSELGVRHAA